MSKSIGVLLLTCSLIAACQSSPAPAATATPTVALLPTAAASGSPVAATPGVVTPSPSAATSAPPSDSAGRLAQATIATFRFDPQPVRVPVGGTVRWTNNDTVPHTVTSGEGDDPDGIFDSDRIEPGQAFEFSFDTSGVFAYFCNLHPRMTGQVEVSP